MSLGMYYLGGSTVPFSYWLVVAVVSIRPYAVILPKLFS